MFGSPKIQISYNARLRRARVIFRAGECFKYRQPPLKALAKMQLRFAQDKEDGYIEAYALFTQRLVELWQHVRKLQDSLDPNHEIRLTIGQGGRLYKEIILAPPKGAEIALISCNFAERRVENIPFNAFVFNVILKLQELKIELLPDRAQLRFLYLLLKNGQKLENLALKAEPENIGVPLLVQFDQEQRYVTLHLFDYRWLRSPENREKIWKKSLQELNRLNRSKLPMTLLKSHSMEKLNSLASKMQGIGFNMPYDLLIAYDASYRFDTAQLQAEKAFAQEAQEDLARWRQKSSAKHQGDYFKIEVLPDGMSAKIIAVNKATLDQIKTNLDPQWLVSELEKQGIVHGFDAFIKPILQAIQKDRPLVGREIAAGSAAVPGQIPFLHIFSEQEGELESQQLNIREHQNRRLVEQGELIAEVRTKDAQTGKTVRGQAIHALSSAAKAGWLAGEGVRLEDDSRFYALHAGLINQTAHSLSCEKTYIHKGSINLSSGNLSFDGSVVIQGDIESGATVNVRGNLLVEGMISQASVRCSGDLSVKGGIITGPAAQVHAEGKIFCNFIENSEIQVRGALFVNRSILHSNVIAGGPIAILDERRGIIAGGCLSSWSAIRTANCGMPQGAATECRVGSDFNAALQLKRCRQRLQHFMAKHKQLLTGMAELEAEESQEDPVDLGALRQQQIRLQKLERIVQKLTKRGDYLELHMHWNINATLVVSGVLDKRTEIIASGRKLALGGNHQGLLITGRDFHGSHLIDLDKIKIFQQAYPETQLASLKKSS